MSGIYIRGALVEYASDFLGPLPNVVIFQFNPEQLVRTINIPSPRAETTPEPRQKEPAQTASPPTETFPVTAHFSAADDLGKGGAVSVIPRMFGVGPQLAALEKMVYPAGGIISGANGASLDGVADELPMSDARAPGRPVPREQIPKLLFIWGPSRVLPVQIQSMSITEKKFDALLNPVQAEVQLTLGVVSFPAPSAPRTDDLIGTGALTYTQTIKDAQASANLAKALENAGEIIPF